MQSHRWNGNQGKVDLYHGSASGISATSAQTFTGDSSTNGFGPAITELGDINADGFDDIAVGSPYYNGWTGRVFVFHGSAAGIAAESHAACDPDAATVDNNEDCDDTNADAYPGAPSPVRNEVMDCDAAGYGSGPTSTTSTDASSDGDKGSCATARASTSLAWLAIAGVWSIAGRRRRTSLQRLTEAEVRA